MRVVVPLLNLRVTGGTRITLQHVAALATRGHEVTVVMPPSTDAPYFTMPPGVRLITVDTTGLNAGYASLVMALGRATPMCDLVFANSWQTMLPGLLARVLGRARCVVHFVQGLELFTLSGRGRLTSLRNRLLRDAVLRLRTPKIAVSSWLRNVIRQTYGRDAFCVPNGIDTQTFFPHPRKSRRDALAYDVLCLAREEPTKGFGDLVTAMRRLAADGIGARVTVVTQDHVELPSDLDGRVVAPSDDSMLAELYSGCDVFAFTSWREGFGLPPLEAMACGAAVVTTDCGGVSDFAIDGHNCLVVPARRPDALYEALARLGRDGALRNRLAHAGAATATQFTLTRSTERMLQVLTTIVDRPEAGCAERGATGV